MIKFKLYMDKDAETEWLNEMAKKGYALEKYFLGFYTFEECEAGEYTYQIDLLDNWSGDKEEFESFMGDSGVEVVAQWYRWVYLRKKTVDGPFEMYTDVETKMGQYSRIRRFFMVGIAVEICCLLVELNASIRTGEALFWGFVLFIGVVVVAFLRMSWKCSRKIEQLKKDMY